MNERIQELVKQADIEFDVSSDNYGVDTATVTPYDLEKFAELMAREAIAVVQKRFMGDLNREDIEVRRCVEDLKKHFGVEE
jgi:endonuclease YncB( thermonuclease family)